MSGVLGVLAGSVSGGPTATLSAATYSITGSTPASIQFDSNGEFWATTVDNIASVQYNWLTSGVSSDCKLIYSVTSGTFSGSPPASGSNMGSTLVFTRAGPSSLQSVTASFSIQRVSDSVTIAGPVSITLECQP